MITNPGTLTRRVDIYGTAQVDEGGFDYAGRVLLFHGIAAAIAPVRGQELYEMGATREDQPLKIVIRYRKNVTEDMEVHYQGHVYDIQSVVDPLMEHESLELYCTERKRGAGDGDV